MRSHDCVSASAPMRAAFLIAAAGLSCAGPTAAGPQSASPAPGEASPAAARAAAAANTGNTDAATSAASADTAGLEGDVFVYLKGPMFSEAFESAPVAKVGDESITLRELTDALAATHAGHGAPAAAAGRDFTEVLDRIINVRLLLLEARAMGLDELPEIKTMLDAFKDVSLKEGLKRQVTADVKSKPEDVEKYLKDLTREWKIKSVLFDKEEDAKALVAAVQGGKTFNDLVTQLVADKKAKGGTEAQFLKAKDMLPPIVAAVKDLEVGAVSVPVKLAEGFAVSIIEEVRYPENADARAEAEKASLSEQKFAVLKKYYEGLVKEYATIDQKLLDRLDLEAKKPGFESYMKDSRTVVKIKGEKPVLVSDIVTDIAKKFFHGVEPAIRDKTLNSKKQLSLDSFLYNRLYTKQALADGIDKTETYRRAVAEYTRSVVVGAFIQKAVVPDVNVEEKQAEQYYQDHLADYTYPEFYNLSSLAFSTLAGAQAALDKLNAGTDFKWLKANAEGQVAEDQRKLDLNGNTLTAKGLDTGLAAVLAGTNPGDYRLYQAAEGAVYVIAVNQRVAPKSQPYVEVREAIAKTLYAENMTAAIEGWAKKLRESHKVGIYLTRIGQ